MLSYNIAASIATEINKKASFHITVHNSFSMNFSICGSSAWWSHVCMVHVTALDIQVSLRNPMAMLEDCMSVNTLFNKDTNIILLSKNKKKICSHIVQFLFELQSQLPKSNFLGLMK